MEEVDWSHGAEHMFEGHTVTVDEANSALADPRAVVLEPDPASTSGRGIRVIGYSAVRDRVLVVILVRVDGVLYGKNGWPASRKDQRRYTEGV